MAKISTLQENATAVYGNGIISNCVKSARDEGIENVKLVKGNKRKPSKEVNQPNKRRRKYNLPKPQWKKGVWDQCEDQILLAAVHEQFPLKDSKIDWTEVSLKVRSRSCKQCRERWVNHLNPDVNKAKWTPHEDTLLLELGEIYPKKWAQIARMIPGRTENMVKIRWNSLTRKGNSPSKREPNVSGWVPPLKPKSLDFGCSGQALQYNFPLKFDPLKSNPLEFVDPFESYPEDNFHIEESFLLDTIDSFGLDVL